MSYLTVRPFVVTVVLVLIASLMGCDLLDIGEPDVAGAWQGRLTIEDTSVEMELELTQTIIREFPGRTLYTIGGNGRYMSPTASLAFSYTVEGTYLYPQIVMELKAPGVAPLRIVGKVSGDEDTITGHLEKGDNELPLTLWRE